MASKEILVLIDTQSEWWRRIWRPLISFTLWHVEILIETSKTLFNNDQPREKQVLVKLLFGLGAEGLIYSLDQQSV